MRADRIGWLFACFGCAVAAVWLAGCGQPGTDARAPVGGGSKDYSDQLYIEVSAVGSAEYFFDHKLGMRLAGEFLGVRTEYVGPPDYDMAAMVTAFEQAIAKRPNGIVVVGFEDSLDAIVDKAIGLGIPVVTVDADLPGSKRLCFVGTGNYHAGYAGGKKLASLIGGKGRVAIMGKVGQSNLEERIQGYKAALGEHPEVELVQIVDTQLDPTVAAQGATTVLQKFPDLAGLACVDSFGGVGAATAVKEMKLQGKVAIVSMDRGDEILEYIEQGVISATVAQHTALMPFYAVQALFNLNNFGIPISGDNKKAGVAEIPPVIDTGVTIIDKENCRYFFRNR